MRRLMLAVIQMCQGIKVRHRPGFRVQAIGCLQLPGKFFAQQVACVVNKLLQAVAGALIKCHLVNRLLMNFEHRHQSC